MTTPAAPTSDSPAPADGSAPTSAFLRQLVYASTVAQPPAPLDDILRVARRKNRERGVTGVLLHAPDRFMQYLEGPPAAVAEVFEAITADPRHHSVTVLADGPVAGRSFGDWAMAAAEVDTMAWLRLTLAAWPPGVGAGDVGGAGAVRVDAPSGLKLLEEFRPALASGPAPGSPSASPSPGAP